VISQCYDAAENAFKVRDKKLTRSVNHVI